MKNLSLLLLSVFFFACTNAPEDVPLNEPAVEMKEISLKPLSIAEDPFNPNAFNPNLEQPTGLSSMIDIFYSFPFGYLSHFDKTEREKMMNQEESFFLTDEANHYLSFEIPDSQTDTFVFTVFLNDKKEWLIAYSQKICPAHCTQELGFYRFEEGTWVDVSSTYLPQLELTFEAEDDGKNHSYYYQLPRNSTEITIVEGLYEATEEDGEPVAGLQWDGEGFVES